MRLGMDAVSKERQITVDEAIVWITKYCITKQYKTDCYEYWREHLGTEFVEQVKAGIENKNGR